MSKQRRGPSEKIKKILDHLDKDTEVFMSKTKSPLKRKSLLQEDGTIQPLQLTNQNAEQERDSFELSSLKKQKLKEIRKKLGFDQVQSKNYDSLIAIDEKFSTLQESIEKEFDPDKTPKGFSTEFLFDLQLKLSDSLNIVESIIKEDVSLENLLKL